MSDNQLSEDDQLRSYLLKKGHATATADTYIKYLNAFLQWCVQIENDPHFITYSDMLNYLKELRKRNLKPSTISNILTALSHYYDELLHQQKIHTHPVRYLNVHTPRIPTLHHLLTQPQLEGLYTHFHPQGERLTKPSALAAAHRKKVTIGLMVFQGLDTHALARLRVEDLHLAAGTVHITECRKHARRTLSLQSAQIMEFYRYLEDIRPQLLHHFPQQTNALLVHGYTHYYDAHRRLLQRLKRQEPALTSARQIRSSLITHWLKTYNLREVQHMAGHRDVYSTEAYQRNDTQSLQLDIDNHHPIN